MGSLYGVESQEEKSKRYMQLLDTNNEKVQELAGKYKQQLDPFAVTQMRINMLTEHLFPDLDENGRPQEHQWKDRLDFEISYQEMIEESVEGILVECRKAVLTEGNGSISGMNREQRRANRKGN